MHKCIKYQIGPFPFPDHNCFIIPNAKLTLAQSSHFGYNRKPFPLWILKSFFFLALINFYYGNLCIQVSNFQVLFANFKWTVRLCNIQTRQRPPATWLALEKTAFLRGSGFFVTCVWRYNICSVTSAWRYKCCASLVLAHCFLLLFYIRIYCHKNWCYAWKDLKTDTSRILDPYYPITDLHFVWWYNNTS